MWEKRATSAEGKTIRIAESSDMDSWEAVLGHVQSFAKMCKFLGKDLSFEREKGSGDVTQLYQMVWYELWRYLDHDETWSGKRRSFGEINKMVIFREKCFFKKRTSYLFQQTSTFGKNVLKEISYKDLFMGKRSKSLLFF